MDNGLIVNFYPAIPERQDIEEVLSGNDLAILVLKSQLFAGCKPFVSKGLVCLPAIQLVTGWSE